jgi:hypothetical protein
MELCANLSNQDATGLNQFTAEVLDTKALSVTVATVAG